MSDWMINANTILTRFFFPQQSHLYVLDARSTFNVFGPMQFLKVNLCTICIYISLIVRIVCYPSPKLNISNTSYNWLFSGEEKKNEVSIKKVKLDYVILFFSRYCCCIELWNMSSIDRHQMIILFGIGCAIEKSESIDPNNFAC